MADITVDFPNDGTDYIGEMNEIKKSLSQYQGYKTIAALLGKYYSQEIVAGLIGCIIPESGGDHTILNTKEYRGYGASGTSGWNCGEGLMQWTYWKYKKPIIEKYNSDNRSTQKLTTDWENYKQGTPIEKWSKLYSPSDGQHIAGLSLENQILFLTIYYDSVIKKLNGVTNLALITAKLYQYKAGNSYNKEISNPIERAYKTALKYSNNEDNHYLQSIKIAKEYYFNGQTQPTSEPPVEETVTTNSNTGTTKVLADGTRVSPDGTVNNLSDASNKKNTNKYGIILGYNLQQK